MSAEACGKHCLLAHAMVYNKVQGATGTGTVMLRDTANKYVKRCHLYVGLNRVTSGRALSISSDASLPRGYS